MQNSAIIPMQPIGVIHSGYTSVDEIPNQGLADTGATATLELFPEYREGAANIAMGDSAVILFCFHEAPEKPLTVISADDGQTLGVFSTRSPHRPNPIGMTVVRFLSNEGGILTFSGCDMLNGTPVLDIKPIGPGLPSVSPQ